MELIGFRAHHKLVRALNLANFTHHYTVGLYRRGRSVLYVHPGLGTIDDFRRLREMIESGDGSAQLAYDVFIHRLRKYVGAYLAILGHTDVVSFTAGVGENAAEVRLDALNGLEGLGIEVDAQRNSQAGKGARRISTDDSAIAVLVVPTNEELAIARDCLRAI